MQLNKNKGKMKEISKRNTKGKEKSGLKHNTSKQGREEKKMSFQTKLYQVNAAVNHGRF